MYCDANGRPDPNGDYELINDTVCVRSGRTVSFSRFMTDGSSSAKSKEPTSIDEALRQRFAEMARQAGTSVKELLATMQQKQIEETAAEVATSFISSRAGAGIAAEFGDAATVLSDAEQSYVVAIARADHENRYGYLPAGQRPPFTADAAKAAVTDALKAKVLDRAAQMVMASDEYADPSFRQGMELAQRITRKRAASNAWRR